MNKKTIISIALCGAAVISLDSCSDEPHGVSTKHPVGSEVPSGPSFSADDDVTSPLANFPLRSQKVTVNTSMTYQEMEGFAASDCWLPNQIGQYWTDNRNDIAQLLFSQNISADGQPQGIGLSMWRVNLGAGTEEQGDNSNMSLNNRAQSYLSTGSYNWNSCAGQRYFMEQAKNMGCEKFVLFSNSPLVQYTLNGMGYSDNGAHGNLKEEGYSQYAEYMAEVAKHFTEAGYNISHISPVNEPQYDWGVAENGMANQEGSGWQNTEIAKLVKELDKSLTARDLDTYILIAEAGAWTELYQGGNARSNTIDAFYNPTSNAYVGDIKRLDNIICGHSYWTEGTWTGMRDVRSKVAAAAKERNLKVYQTEWSMLGDAPAELDGNYDNATEFDIAQYMSRVIHNDITVAGCASWSYWTAMSVERWGQKNRFELIKTTPKGGVDSDDFKQGGTVAANPNLWVLGNYSLFVRPGYKRVDLTLDETKDFFGSAYLAPEGNKLVVVLTNYDKTNGVTVDMPNPEGVKAVFTYTTTADKNLKQERFNLNDKVFIDPASVTTIVYYL
ncbi:MAG: beta-glycosidase [Muribaculaceae bacterium]|nr:beta-glycosidase [Muribaculaceae bacterium]